MATFSKSADWALCTFDFKKLDEKINVDSGVVQQSIFFGFSKKNKSITPSLLRKLLNSLYKYIKTLEVFLEI
jgi:ABC-type enterochelin transport system permease subunit